MSERRNRHRGLSRAASAYAAERLESRLLLSTYTVTNLNDSGPGSLRDSLQQAEADPRSDIIKFAPSLTAAGAASITLDSQLEISTDITITRPGADLLALSGNNSSRVLEVDAGANATVSGLTFTQGHPRPGNGGGIVNAGTLTLANSVVSGNEVERDIDGGSGSGGGIANLGTLTLTNSTVSHNTEADDGGIFNLGVLTINNSTVSNNLTIDEFGGGIANYGTLTLTNSTVSGADADVFHLDSLYPSAPPGAGDLLSLCEIVSGDRLEGGQLVRLIDDQWLNLWRQYRASHRP